MLIPMERDARNAKLKEILSEINNNLPSNVYIPIDTAFEDNLNSNSSNRRIQPKSVHKVLRVDLDHAFCLHSKERVPFHILIEVATVTQ
jgi:hypothetical protein